MEIGVPRIDDGGEAMRVHRVMVTWQGLRQRYGDKADSGTLLKIAEDIEKLTSAAYDLGYAQAVSDSVTKNDAFAAWGEKYGAYVAKEDEDDGVTR